MALPVGIVVIIAATVFTMAFKVTAHPKHWYYHDRTSGSYVNR
jgi:hypothetical protein